VKVDEMGNIAPEEDPGMKKIIRETVAVVPEETVTIITIKRTGFYHWVAF
jgi:hypothetical protein